MTWWVVEAGTTILLIAIVLTFGPLIKRFGRAYAGDIFRANPRTGKSYLVLMDIAYYLIFTAYILFTISVSERPEWRSPGGGQLSAELTRVGGMLLLMGLLHGLNVISLPLIGRLLGLSRELESDTPPPP